MKKDIKKYKVGREMSKVSKKGMLSIVMAFLFAFTLFGCNTENKQLKAPETNTVVPEFNQDLNLMLFADRPPAFKVEYLQDYKDAGFTHYVMTEDHAPLTNADGIFGNTDDGVVSDLYKSAFEVCEDLGLKTVIRNMYNDEYYFNNNSDEVRHREAPFENLTYRIPVRSLTTEVTSLKTVEGFFMCDEPSYKKIDTLIPLVEWYNANVSDGIFHMNLNPGHATFMFSGHTYEEYVQHYIDTILSKVNGKKTLSIDRYPLMEEAVSGEKYVEDGFLFDYMVVAEKAKALKHANPDKADEIVTNFYIQAYKEANVRTLTQVEEIKWLTNIALTFGAKSMGYYLYYSLYNNDGMVELGTYKKLPLYDFVKQANAEVQGTADAIMNFDWNGAKVYSGSQLSDERNQKAFNKVASKTTESFALIENVECRLDTVVSEMKDKSNNKAYAIMNYSEPTKGQIDAVNVYFNSLINKAVIYVNGEKKVVDVNNNVLSLDVGPGEMAFVYPVYNI